MNHIAHFAVHADDVERARAFYSEVFGWTFSPWGPPGFYMISTDEGGIHGSLQARAEPVAGNGICAFECTVAVADVDAIGTAIAAAGGEIVMAPMEIPTVGRVLRFRDPEGNVVCAMQYVEGLASGDPT